MSTENQEPAVEQTTAPEDVTDISSPEYADSLVNEFGHLFGDEPSSQSEEVTAETKETTEKGTAEAGAGDSKPGESEPKPGSEEEKPLLSPQLAAAAARERETRAKIAALEESREKDIADAVSAVINELKRNPQEFIRKHELDPGDLALNAYALELGDEAPVELKQQLGMSEVERLRAEFQQELANLKQEQASVADRIKAQTALEQYKGYLSSVPSELQYLRAEASYDQDETLRAMAEVADYVYETEGRIPAATEVAKVLDDQLRATLERYNSIQKSVNSAEKPTASNVAPTETNQETTTLNNDLTAGRAAAHFEGEDEQFISAMEWMAANYKPSR